MTLTDCTLFIRTREKRKNELTHCEGYAAYTHVNKRKYQQQQVREQKPAPGKFVRTTMSRHLLNFVPKGSKKQPPGDVIGFGVPGPARRLAPGTRSAKVALLIKLNLVSIFLRLGSLKA
jgi:hypothetical protein